MNDRFRFRFVHNSNKKVYEVIRIEYDINIITTLDDNGFAEFHISEGELIQCTGIKDKNGKLIYEGDILELYISSKRAYRYQVKYEIGSFMLVSDGEIFDFKNKWNDNAYPLSQLYFEYENEENCIWHCEVIGNIYENPELPESEE